MLSRIVLQVRQVSLQDVIHIEFVIKLYFLITSCIRVSNDVYVQSLLRGELMAVERTEVGYIVV